MAQVGDNAPDFELAGTDGPFRLSAHRGERVVLVFGVTQPILGTRRGVVIVDEAGRIAYRHVYALGLDFQTVDELREALASLAAAA